MEIAVSKAFFKFCREWGKQFKRLDLGGIMGTIIAFLTLVAAINHSEIFNVSSRLEALWFAVQLFLIAVLSILGFQLLGFILENIGEISN